MTIEEKLMVFCKNVKFLRKQNHLSKSDMAKLLQIPIGALENIECGIVTNIITADVLLILGNYFHIPCHEFFRPLNLPDKQL